VKGDILKLADDNHRKLAEMFYVGAVGSVIRFGLQMAPSILSRYPTSRSDAYVHRKQRLEK
jgi:hypothetical protein